MAMPATSLMDTGLASQHLEIDLLDTCSIKACIGFP